jgi:methylated-DNA-[protein]-cysteine S-methyltransferase
MTEHACTMDSPIGALTILSNGEALLAIYTAEQPHPAAATGTDAVLERACTQLREYFAGTRRAFELPLAPKGTEFQRRVWSALCEIPAGATMSYGALAARLGSPGAARAVGLANSKNPISIVVPCHRVIGANGSLTGYAGGLACKRWLLEHERRWAQGESAPTTARTRALTRSRAEQTSLALESGPPRHTTTSSSGAVRRSSVA